jgi:hypothetical protein
VVVPAGRAAYGAGDHGRLGGGPAHGRRPLRRPVDALGRRQQLLGLGRST